MIARTLGRLGWWLVNRYDVRVPLWRAARGHLTWIRDGDEQ